MADYHYQPDMNDPVAKLRSAMNNMDVDAIRRYTIPSEREDYSFPITDLNLDSQHLTGEIKSRSNLRLFPPPVFSRQGIPQNYQCVNCFPFSLPIPFQAA